MPRPVIVSPRAMRDIRKIRRWITKEGGRASAEAVTDRLVAVLQMLTEHPLAGSDASDFATALRSFAARPYLVFYRVRPHHVEIVRVLDGRRDLPRVLRDGID